MRVTSVVRRLVFEPLCSLHPAGVYVNSVLRCYGEALFNMGQVNTLNTHTHASSYTHHAVQENGDPFFDFRHSRKTVGNHIPLEFNLRACTD